jgi:hypothetical protein
MAIHVELSERLMPLGNCMFLNPQVEDIPAEDDNSRNPAKYVSLTHDILGPR